MTNPFMPQQPQQPAQQPQQNPYAPAPAAPQNPYAPAPAAPAQQPQNPYGGQAAAQQQYTQQPAQYAAPAAAANVPVAQPGQFLAPPPPSATGAGNIPKIGDLQGRLLIVMPETVARQVPSKFQGQGGAQQFMDRMTCTIIVLDGGPLSWGGTTPGSQRQTVNPPHAIKGIWVQQTKLVEQLEEALRVRQAGGPGLALGRLWKTGPSNNDPYVLAAPQPDEVNTYNAYVQQQNPFAV